MQTIYYAEGFNISFNDSTVQINSANVASELFEKAHPSEYAYDKMRSFYKSILSRQYENVVVLSGAGTSAGIGTGPKIGKTMAGLWKTVVQKIGFDSLKKFAEDVHFNPILEDYTDLEDLLSHALLAESYLHNEYIETTIRTIESIICNECTLTLPDNAPHTTFLRKITARKLKYSRVKLFTLNYDLLFEQAASQGGYVVVDGFSFDSSREFNGINYDYDIVIRNSNRAISEENFAPKVFHLYKPHGSLDWERITRVDKDVFVKSSSPEHPVMIFPSNSKFEYSYEQPFFEMISRFQQELRNKNTLLISIGFSFYDKHIRTMIMEALNVNPSITLIVVAPDVMEDKKYVELKAKSSVMKNVVLINETFSDFAKNYPYSDVYDYSKEVLINEPI